ncbi:hypothetical protein HIV01_016350 [Lysobacter arenosi]|uniref:Uncharacterized protein n=1 Tax=Lysobacter arenosi TaxID=2795387 RepID=A0ABX7R9B8_9GAMM|nr:hypothetical protein [Lysobacter arenosi]QSX74718.1 hypothetical protein HIV01_016350 [Lysobacter arenosi]
MSHSHHFHSWAFREPVETGTFTTRQVLEGGFPILEVYHDADGDWQFLCGTTTDTEDLKLVCLGCMVERDSGLLALADLPLGWCAVRDRAEDPWLREPYESREDEA